VNPFGDFLTLTTKKKKKSDRKEKKKTRPTAGETQPWVSMASGSAARWVGREVSQKSDRKEKKKKPDPRPARPSRGSRWLVGWLRGGSAAKCLRATTRSFRRDPAETQRRQDPSFFLLLFSSLSCSIVKSLLLQCGSHVGGCRILFCIFFSFYEVSVCDWWAKNTTFLPHPN
jgi:hypothetical protein